MNFAEFQTFRDQLLVERGDVIDCGTTNLYAALARLIPPVSGAANGRVHRCHLATEWAAAFGFASDISRRALVSCGVRDSLALLFQHYAAVAARVWLPADNYPVYHELAAAQGLRPDAFVTLPTPAWPALEPVAGPEILLVTNPLKPLGRNLDREDVITLSDWLARSAERRVILDAVYALEPVFDAATLELFATGQTILLHSLTKGWLQPRLFGVALVPGRDVAALAPRFRAHPPPQENLARARALLARHRDMPARVKQGILDSRRRMFAQLSSRMKLPAATVDHVSYFTPVAARWSELLEETHVLGLPASVFGSERDDLTVLSSLSFAQ